MAAMFKCGIKTGYKLCLWNVHHAFSDTSDISVTENHIGNQSLNLRINLNMWMLGSWTTYKTFTPEVSWTHFWMLLMFSQH